MKIVPNGLLSSPRLNRTHPHNPSNSQIIFCCMIVIFLKIRHIKKSMFCITDFLFYFTCCSVLLTAEDIDKWRKYTSTMCSSLGSRTAKEQDRALTMQFNGHFLCEPGVKLGGGSRRISHSAPLIWDPLPDPLPHSWDPAPFFWDPPLCWEESKHQTLFKCYKSPTECLECSKTPGQRSGAPPMLSALWAPTSALQASRL